MKCLQIHNIFRSFYRNWRLELHWTWTWRTTRSHGQGVPQGDQMYLPQIRFFRYRWKIRWSLRFAPQHHQRKDLHLRLVLAHFRRCCLRIDDDLQDFCLSRIPIANCFDYLSRKLDPFFLGSQWFHDFFFSKFPGRKILQKIRRWNHLGTPIHELPWTSRWLVLASSHC